MSRMLECGLYFPLWWWSSSPSVVTIPIGIWSFLKTKYTKHYAKKRAQIARKQKEAQ